MRNADQTDEAHSVDLAPRVDPCEEVRPQCRNSILDLHVEPDQINLVEQDERPDLLVDVLRESFYRKTGEVGLDIAQKAIQNFAFDPHHVPIETKLVR